MKGSGEQESGLPAAVETLMRVRTDDAVFVVGPDYRIVHWDPRAEFVTGLPATEVLDEPLYEVLSGEREDGAPFCRNGCPVMTLARAGRAVPSHEARLYSPAGEERWVGVTVLGVESEEGPYLIFLIRDSQRLHDILEMARTLVRSWKRNSPGPTGEPPELTPRQREVLRLLSEGKSAKAIGEELNLAEATVRGHVRSLLAALGAHSQVEALARAREMGLTSE